MRDDLGVGVRLERDALGLQLRAQLAEVLHDAVLDDHQLAGVVGMRMGVALAGLAVGGPARVPDADIARDRAFVQAAGEIAQLADVATDRDLAILDDRDAGRIVAAILQPPQAFQDDLGRVARANITDDPTHG